MVLSYKHSFDQSYKIAHSENSSFNKQKIKASMDNAILALRVISEIWMKYFEHISAFNPAKIK